MIARAEGAGFLRDETCLKGHWQTSAHSYTDQQLERDVRYTTIDDLAQSRLGEAEPFCGYDLRDTHTMCVACKLHGDITAQRPNGSDIGGGYVHSESIISSGSEQFQPAFSITCVYTVPRSTA